MVVVDVVVRARIAVLDVVAQFRSAVFLIAAAAALLGRTMRADRRAGCC